MARIDEHEVFAQFIGVKVDQRKLETIARSNGAGYGSCADSKEYITAHVDYYDVKEFLKRFGLTSTLTERWDYKGIDFSVYLYIRDEIITGGHAFKYAAQQRKRGDHAKRRVLDHGTGARPNDRGIGPVRCGREKPRRKHLLFFQKR